MMKYNTPFYKNPKLLLLLPLMMLAAANLFGQEKLADLIWEPDRSDIETEMLKGPVKYVWSVGYAAEERNGKWERTQLSVDSDKHWNQFLFLNEQRNPLVHKIMGTGDESYARTYVYDANGHTKEIQMIGGGMNFKAKVTNNQKGQPEKMVLVSIEEDGQSIEREPDLIWKYHYDPEGKLLRKESKMGDKPAFMVEYSYQGGKLTEWVYGVMGIAKTGFYKKTSYRYDENGNLKETAFISEGDENAVRRFNAKGAEIEQIIGDDSAVTTTFNHTYDQYGNWIKAVVRLGDGSTYIREREIAYYDYGRKLDVKNDWELQYLKGKVKKWKGEMIHKTGDTATSGSKVSWETTFDKHGKIQSFKINNEPDVTIINYEYIYDSYGNEVLGIQKDSEGAVVYAVPQYNKDGLYQSLVLVYGESTTKNRYEYTSEGRLSKIYTHISAPSITDVQNCFEYNPEGYASSMTTYFLQEKTMTTEKSRYKYDHTGNWTEREIYENGKLLRIMKRKLEYYD